jgi:hypothetical protein
MVEGQGRGKSCSHHGSQGAERKRPGQDAAPEISPTNALLPPPSSFQHLPRVYSDFESISGLKPLIMSEPNGQRKDSHRLPLLVQLN